MSAEHQGAAGQPSGGTVVWITGLPAAGKTTLAAALCERLQTGAPRGVHHLDGDALRAAAGRDLGFDRDARREQARRASARAEQDARAGAIVLVSLVSPYRADRDEARSRIQTAGLRFVEVFLDTAPAVCRRRDPKGLYRAAREGRLHGLTGWDAPYERPPRPEVRIDHDEAAPVSVSDSVEVVLAFLLGDRER